MTEGDAAVDAIVVGGGPAGLAAGLWLARYRRDVLVLDADEPRNRPTEQTHGYLGLDPVDPEELRRRGRKELSAYACAQLRPERVMRVQRDGDRFDVETQHARYGARRLVLAMGTGDVLPDVEGIEEHYGSQVFHCPTCDGYEARDARVLVLGWGEQITGFSISLLNWARDVTVVTDGRRLEADPDERSRLDEAGIRVIEGVARRMIGERGDLRGIELANGGECIDADLAFFSIEHVPNTELADDLGCERDDDGHVLVNARQLTSVPGVYAAGDLTPGMQLVAVAVAEGTVAGVCCALSL